MINHPNRSKRAENPARNPSPEEIRATREATGLSQTEAGQLLYRTLRNWQQWEAGDRKMDPALWELFKLKTAMNSVR